MPDEHTHPLLQQTALAVNPFIDLPKPPTLPPNYASLPSTLPPSILSTASTAPGSGHSAYVTSSSGNFAAHPSSIIVQNRSLSDQIRKESEEGRKRIAEWEDKIEERELQERRRKAPGWLDREERILQPARLNEARGAAGDLMNAELQSNTEEERRRSVAHHQREVDDLGEAMDRAFGRSEMG